MSTKIWGIFERLPYEGGWLIVAFEERTDAESVLQAALDGKLTYRSGSKLGTHWEIQEIEVYANAAGFIQEYVSRHRGIKYNELVN